MRKEAKCKAGKECNCEKLKYPDLNIHEKEVMEILEIVNVKEEELAKCVIWLKEWKEIEDKKSNNEEKTWLWLQVTVDI